MAQVGLAGMREDDALVRGVMRHAFELSAAQAKVGHNQEAPLEDVDFSEPLHTRIEVY